MISKPTPSSTGIAKNPAPLDLEGGEHFDTSGLDVCIHLVTEDFQAFTRKLSSSKTRFRFTPTKLKQFCFGLDSNVVRKLNPLTEHLCSPESRSVETFEQLAELAESVVATIQSGDSSNEFRLDEVGGPHGFAGESSVVAAVSALLVASQLRKLALGGTDVQLERTLRSFHVIATQSLDTNSTHSLLLQQLVGIELPLLLATQLHFVKPLRKQGKLTNRLFAQVTRNLLDSDGWPHHRCLPVFSELLASWVRCVRLADANGFTTSSSFRVQLEWLAEQFVRLHGPERKLFFSSENADKTSTEFMRFVLELSASKTAKILAESNGLLLSGKSKSKFPSKVDPSCVSEWSESAVIRSSWSRKSPCVAIDFSKPCTHLEVAAKEKLIHGTASLEIFDDKSSIELGDQGFGVVCELADEDISYLELELKLDSVHIFRQVLLSRTEQFLYFADSIHKSGAGLIDYRLNLPLASGMNVVRENGTREVYLNRKGKGIRSLVMPLSLPEWNAERCRGLFYDSVDATRGTVSLRLEQSIELPQRGGALYCPMFFDLSPKRSRQKRTWRQLTVAENLGIVRPEVASAFRVQVAEKQWVFYRALQSIQNRTFLGQNFSGDFFAAQFFKNGKVNELVEVH